MRWTLKAVVVAAVLAPATASDAVAQQRTATGVQRLARRDVPQQPSRATTAGPKWSMVGGVASGDGEYDLGFSLGTTARWSRSNWPVTIRGDGYFAHHSGDINSFAGDFDLSLNLLGVLGSAEYSFPTQSSLKPYVFGGLGLFYAAVDVDYDEAFGDGDYDSSTDLGFSVGGGLNFTPRFGMELRLIDVGGFTTLPIVAVLRF